MNGFLTLLHKEVLRFWKVSFQTLAAPVVTSMLYLLIFSHALSSRIGMYRGVSYAAFLVPGLAMMSLLQSSFANTSSSLIQSKITGNIVFVLLSPLSYLEFFGAYVLASMVRGLIVGAGILAVGSQFAPLRLGAPLWVLAFALLGSGIMATLGLVAGMWADKFDQLAGFQNFLVMPLTFLSGVFYSIHSLPPFWAMLSRFNPFFYIVDGFRYGFFGVSDVPAALSLAAVGASFLALCAVTLGLLRAGYKLRH